MPTDRLQAVLPDSLSPEAPDLVMNPVLDLRPLDGAVERRHWLADRERGVCRVLERVQRKVAQVTGRFLRAVEDGGEIER